MSSPSAWPQEGPISIILFSGSVTEAICTPVITGPNVSGNTLHLPDVYINDITSAGLSVGSSPITFSVDECKVSNNYARMWTYFQVPVLDGTGRIVPTDIANIDSGVPYQTNVRFEIRDNNSSGALVVPNGPLAGIPTGIPPATPPIAATLAPLPTQGTSVPFTGSFHSRSASKTYVIQYYIAGLPVKTGAISVPLTYAVIFH